MSDVARGRFVWYDLMTPDPAGAEAFYTRLLGWGTEIWNPGAMPYTMFTNAGGAVGGHPRASPHKPST
ncbi:MAG: hypothetical protein HC897_08910, partial [Thermoanaerobaculia bacterium]|nr:hypothetical protein [Thermoanaerobaculia bacterium]